MVLDFLVSGLNPAQASRAAGVSLAYAYGLHHKMGGVYRPPDVTYSARYLDREERYELARLRQRRPKPSRLARDPVLRAGVQRLLDRRCSPEQASGRLTVEFPGDPA